MADQEENREEEDRRWRSGEELEGSIDLRGIKRKLKRRPAKLWRVFEKQLRSETSASYLHVRNTQWTHTRDNLTVG